MQIRIALLAILLSGSAFAVASRDDVEREIDKLDTAVDAEVSQDLLVIDALNMVTAKPLTLTVGTVGGGPVVDIPVYFKSGSTAVSSIQLDVVLSSGLVVNSVSPGLAALAAQKGVQGNAVAGGHRMVIFGVNQNPIPSGAVVMLKINVGANVGKIPLGIRNIAASDAAGSAVAVVGWPGSISVR